MVNYTISKKEAMFRIQRLVASSNVRFFNVGEVNASQVGDIVSMFQTKYNIFADKNERKRLERAGQPIWHLVLWYDYVRIGVMNYYLFTTGFKKPKSEKKVFDVEAMNAELVEKEHLKDLYGGDLLTFGRYVLGQYIDYESPYDKSTKGFPKEYRHPENFNDMFIPQLFNYVRSGNYYKTFTERMNKLKQRYATEQHNLNGTPLPSSTTASIDSEEALEVDSESFTNLNTEADKELIVSDDLINTESAEYIAADKLVRKMRYDQFVALKNYARFELNPEKDIELLSEHHPNFRSDLSYAEIHEIINSKIKSLQRRVERIGREAFINELAKHMEVKKLMNMSHQGLKDLWLNINKRRIYLYYNRLCEDRTRTVRWTWYVRKHSMYEINQQMKYAIKHMGRGGDEFVKKLENLYRMAGFHGVRHQIGSTIARAKREAKHAFPKVFNGLTLPNSFAYVTTIPITIFSLKQFHDECITASVKHLRLRLAINEREANRGNLRKALRDKSEHFKNMPTYELDKYIDQQFNDWLDIKVSAEDLYDFLKKHDDMNPKYLNLGGIADIEKDDIDRSLVSDLFEQHVSKMHKQGLDNNSVGNEAIKTRKRKTKSDSDDNKSETKVDDSEKPKTDAVIQEVDNILKSELNKSDEKDDGENK